MTLRSGAGPDAGVGLCSACRHGLAQTGGKGRQFWRCLRARSDRDYPRYPPLPVLDCPGFERPPPGRRT